MTIPSTSDPFSKWRPNNPSSGSILPKEINQTQSTFFQNINEEDPFSKWRPSNPNQNQEPGFFQEAARHASRIASRVVETIGGTPGDIQDLIQSGVFAGLEKLIGHKVTPEMRREAAIKSQRAPTTAELRKTSEELTRGYTKPRTPTEESIDEYASTVASLLGPMKFRKALGVGLGASFAKEGVKLSGLGERPQEAAKLGTMVLLTAMNPGGALKYASSQYDKANSLAKGASIVAQPLEKHLNSLLSDLKQGVSTPAKNAVMRPAEELLGKINKGKIAVQDLTAAKRDLNTLMKDPELLRREKRLLKGVAKNIDDVIKPYEKINPAFSKAYRPANEIYGAVMQGNKAYDFIKKNLGGKSILAAALGEAALGHPEYIPATLVGGAGIMGAAKTGDFFLRLAKSSQLQKYYLGALSAAAIEDLSSLRLYAEKIEKEMEK